MALDDDPLISGIRKAINAEIGRIKDNIASNGCADFNEYKHKTGKIKGLELSLVMIDDTITSTVHDDD